MTSKASFKFVILHFHQHMITEKRCPELCHRECGGCRNPHPSLSHSALPSWQVVCLPLSKPPILSAKTAHPLTHSCSQKVTLCVTFRWWESCKTYTQVLEGSSVIGQRSPRVGQGTRPRNFDHYLLQPPHRKGSLWHCRVQSRGLSTDILWFSEKWGQFLGKWK